MRNVPVRVDLCAGELNCAAQCVLPLFQLSRMCRDEWYYYYQFWPVGSIPSESNKVLGVAEEDRVNLLRRSEGLAATDCGPGFDACKTVVTTTTEEVIQDDTAETITWTYVKVEQSCAYIE